MQFYRERGLGEKDNKSPKDKKKKFLTHADGQLCARRENVSVKYFDAVVFTKTKRWPLRNHEIKRPTHSKLLSTTPLFRFQGGYRARG